jgi:hypothetical protein
MSHLSDNNLQLPIREYTKEQVNAIRFDTRTNITNKQIDTIFSNGMKLQSVPDDKHPYFIFLIGSPGVGKTYTLNHFFGKRLDNFYKVSLDLILEKITPFRTTTKQIYNLLKGEQKDNQDPDVNFTKNDFGLLNFSTIYQTSYNNFGIPDKREEKLAKIQSLKNSVEDKKPSKKSTKKNKTKSQHDKFSIIAENSIKRAIEMRYNIIYDTTITPTFSKITNIIQLLEDTYKTYTPDKMKYKICVILVEAKGDDTQQVEQITRQINERHKKMIKEGYIRAIRKSLVFGFIKDNRLGWELAKEHFKKENKYPIEFIKLQNPVNIQQYNISNSNNINSIINKIKNKNNSNKKNNTNLVNIFKKLTLKNNNSKNNK